MAKKLTTKETRLTLIKYTADEIVKRSNSLEQTRKQIQLIEKTKKFFGLTSKDLNDISRILEFKILIGLISLDLTTSVRAYLKAEYQYEGQFFLRQFAVVINEGYKKIYNFKKSNPDGTAVSGNRAKSFWVKEIGSMVNERNNINLFNRYSELTKELDRYFELNFEGIKEKRDLSIHYDKDLLKVYEMIVNLNSESLIKKFIPFYELL
ncbi:MAG: hypothetical protein AAF969_16250, partial [Bacteroidota bacterium]